MLLSARDRSTVVPNGGPMGYLSLWPDTVERPFVSTPNAYDGAVTSNMAIVPTLNGYVDAFAYNSTHLITDIFGYFAAILPLRVVTAALPATTVNHGYSTTLLGGGGVPPYHWIVLSGSLPPGLNLDSGSGVIAGTPTITGDYNFTVRVNDSQLPPMGGSAQLAIQVNATPAQLTINSFLLPEGGQNEPYVAALEATGGVTPYSWSIIGGSLPAGLTLNSSTGAISGAPRGESNNTSPASRQRIFVRNNLRRWGEQLWLDFQSRAAPVKRSDGLHKAGLRMSLECWRRG